MPSKSLFGISAVGLATREASVQPAETVIDDDDVRDDRLLLAAAALDILELRMRAPWALYEHPMRPSLRFPLRPEQLGTAWSDTSNFWKNSA